MPYTTIYYSQIINLEFVFWEYNSNNSANFVVLNSSCNAIQKPTLIDQLINALMRNVRFLSAFGLHTQGMTVEASEKMFLEYAFRDKKNAPKQAALGTFDAAYLNYTLGN